MKVGEIWHPYAHQRLYRRLVGAFARPGTLHSSADTIGDQPVWLGLLATLLDARTGLADPHALLGSEHWRFLQAPPRSPEDADFILCEGGRAPEFSPRLGTLASPEGGATLVIRVHGLGDGRELCLEGPGIAGKASLAVAGLHPLWLPWRAERVSAFPLGVEIVLADKTSFAAIPRSTRVETS